MTFSPQQLVIDNEVFRYMRRALKPIEVNEETLAVKTIREVGVGGNYLESDHTLRHFRDELFFSDLFETMSWATAHEQESEGMDSRALDLAHQLWSAYPEPVLHEDSIKAIDEVISRASQEFLG